MITPQTLKGFRDFLPADAIKRQYVINKIKEVFERFGFDPLETPAVEYAETLLGKYGDEADKLLYLFEDNGGRKVGLRYDQTVPLARVIAQYHNDLPLPFKRYQVQPVWRAENTQKGRYREFIQCDADIIGNTLPALADAEILALFWDIYQTLGFKNIKLSINSRRVLKLMIFRAFPNLDQNKNPKEFLSIVRSLDKLEKIGNQGVTDELLQKGYTIQRINYLFDRISEYKSYDSYQKIEVVDGQLAYAIQIATENFGVPYSALIFDPTLARGLDYYTGIIFESVIAGHKGSLGGGGRYDSLIKQLGGPDVPAIGFAIGFDRTLEVAQEAKLLPDKKTSTLVLTTIYEDKETGKSLLPQSLRTTNVLRKAGVNCEIYLTPSDKFEKQLKYADKKSIPFVLIQRPEEQAKEVWKLKNMRDWTEEKDLTMNDVIQRLTQYINKNAGFPPSRE